MKIKLLKDIREGVQMNSLGVVTNEGALKVSARKDGRAVEFVEGAELEMSDASAAKYIAAGVAVAVGA